MDNTFGYINIREVLSRLKRNKLLQDVTLEAVIQYTIDFIRIVGLKQPYETKEEIIDVHKYRALLPCGLISINQVKDIKTGLCLRGMTNTFDPHHSKEFTYKVQNRVLICGIPECKLLISYNSIAVDEEGFPLLLDDPLWIMTLELYIKQLIYSDKFDSQEITDKSLQNAQQQYYAKVRQLINRYSIPTIDQMESIKNMWTTSIQNTTAHTNGFKTLGRPEILINQ